MTMIASLGGWAVAAVAAGLLVVAWHMLGERMEAVARACHELRGPLAAARLGLSFGSGGELPPGRLRAIDSELARAALALDDLARAPRAAPSIRELDRVDLADLVHDSVEAWRAVAEAGGVMLTELRAAGGGRVWGDRLRLAQAIGNLLANAIIHGGGRVEVRVVGRGPVVRVEVADDGPGLPAPVDELVRRGRHRRGAHGHGLAVAAAVAKLHGGRVAAAPAGTGARLVLELPAAGGD